LVERAPYKREGACSSQAPPILVAPVLAILLVIALLAALAVLWRRARRGMGALG
jgi:hypothetical protein